MEAEAGRDGTSRPTNPARSPSIATTPNGRRRRAMKAKGKETAGGKGRDSQDNGKGGRRGDCATVFERNREGVE